MPLQQLRAGATIGDTGVRGGIRIGAALLVLALTAVALHAGSYLGSDADRLWLANAAWTQGGLIAVVGVAAGAFRSTRRDRPGWMLLLSGCVAWLVGQLFWDLYSARSYPPSPNPADALWLASAMLVAAGVHRLSLGSWRSRRASWLEVVPLILAVCALFTALWWAAIQGSSLSRAAQVTMLAYPIVYVSAVLVMLQSSMAGGLNLMRNRGMAAVLAGLVTEALAFILWCPLLLDGSYVPGTNVLDVMWSGGMVLVGVGAWAARPPNRTLQRQTGRRGWGGALPSLTFVMLAAVQVAHVLGDAAFGARLALSLGVAMVGIALIVRAAVLDRQQGDLLRRLRERERELAEANLRLNEESRRDTLTGLGNRLRLREDFVDLAAGMQRHGRAYCLILFDLDRFKDYNDGLGHQAGDLALRRVAALLETRAGDAIYRYGGEELLLVIREQDARTALEVAERHRARVEKAALPHPHNAPVGVVTMSGGVAVARSGDTPDEVLRRADRALYASKAQGRNRITVAATPQGKVPDVPSQLQPGSATA